MQAAIKKGEEGGEDEKKIRLMITIKGIRTYVYIVRTRIYLLSSLLSEAHHRFEVAVAG